MSALESAERTLLSAPLSPPQYVRDTIPFIAQDYGKPCGGDGINTIADLPIRTPEEERTCNTQYTADLLYIASNGEKRIPPELAKLLHIKIACGTLTVREHAAMVFGFRKETELRDATLPLLNTNTQFARNSLVHAQKYQLLTVSSRPMPPIETFGKVLEFATDDIPPLTPFKQAPKKVLELYVTKYGGSFDPTISEQTARAQLVERYEQDLQGSIFYPSPVEALSHLYGHAQQRWRTFRHKGRIRSFGVNIHRLDGEPRDQYRLRAEGPSVRATRQAAARLILDKLGATDLALYDTSKT